MRKTLQDIALPVANVEAECLAVLPCDHSLVTASKHVGARDDESQTDLHEMTVEGSISGNNSSLQTSIRREGVASQNADVC